MALGLGTKLDKVDTNTNTDENQTTGEHLFRKDSEKGASVDGHRRGSRLEGPARRDLNSSDEESISVGKQIELEAGNAIQYRTCSWQKVCHGLRVKDGAKPDSSANLMLISST